MIIDNLIDNEPPYPNIFLSDTIDQLVTLIISKELGHTKYLEYGVFLGGSIIQANYIAKSLGHRLDFTGIEDFSYLNWANMQMSKEAFPNLLIPTNKDELKSFVKKIVSKSELSQNWLEARAAYPMLDPGMINVEIKDTLSDCADEKFDLIHIDPDHSFQDTVDAFEICLPYSHKLSIFLFDDFVSTHMDVVKAVEYIIQKYKLRYLVGSTNKVAICSNECKIIVQDRLPELRLNFENSYYKLGNTSTVNSGAILNLNRSVARRMKQFDTLNEFFS
jgi:hypothetical protein